ncbi:MAG: hypothetical protein ACFFD7_12885 [Candidatus Thorarchaeota archaeon]
MLERFELLFDLTGSLLTDINDIWDVHKIKHYHFTPRQLAQIQRQLEIHLEKVNEYFKAKNIQQCLQCDRSKRIKEWLSPECMELYRSNRKGKDR